MSVTPKSKPRLLVLAPHPDDAELGCGAFISRWCREYGPVDIVHFIQRDHGSEAPVAASASGILSSTYECVSHWSGFDRALLHRSSILSYLEGLLERLSPFLTLAPASGDMHQEHAMVLNEARRCHKGRNLMTYEIVRSNFHFSPQVFVSVTEEDVDRKVRAVHCYESQRGKFYLSETAIRGLAITRGAMGESPTMLAEAFGVEWVVIP